MLFGFKGSSGRSKKNYVDLILELSEKSEQAEVIEDEINGITYAVDLAGRIKLLLSQEYPFGTYHITNAGEASWYDFAKEIFKIKKPDFKVVPVHSSQFPRKAIRPKKSVLINTKLPGLRSWQEALREYLISK